MLTAKNSEWLQSNISLRLCEPEGKKAFTLSFRMSNFLSLNVIRHPWWFLVTRNHVKSTSVFALPTFNTSFPCSIFAWYRARESIYFHMPKKNTSRVIKFINWFRDRHRGSFLSTMTFIYLRLDLDSIRTMALRKNEMTHEGIGRVTTSRTITSVTAYEKYAHQTLHIIHYSDQ